MIQHTTKKSLLALAMGGFGIGMTEFVIMGLLPNVANRLQVSIPEAGHLISAYALGVVVGAPTLTLLGGKYSPKNLLIFLMGLFTVFNGVSALAPDFHSLLILRFLAGLPHGAYFGVGAVVASRLAEPGKEASAVASMFMGLTMANVLGVPLGTFVGAKWGWPWAFVIVAAIGILTCASLKIWIPVLSKNSSANFKNELKIFKSMNLWLCIAITAIGCGGFFAWISYIAPLLTEVSKFSPATVPLWMVLAGVGMTVGINFGGKLADRISPLRAAQILMFALMIILILDGIFASYGWAMLPLVFLTAMLALAQCPPLQMVIIQNSKAGEMLGSSLGQASFNIGNSLGAFFGGLPLIMGFSYASPPWVGSAMCLVGLFFSLILMRRVSLVQKNIATTGSFSY